MPAPMESPFRQVTPPSSNDESPHPPFLHSGPITSTPRQTAKPLLPQPPLFHHPQQPPPLTTAPTYLASHPTDIRPSPASPPDTSSGSSSSSPMDTLQPPSFFDDSAEMLDYDTYPLPLPAQPASEESSPEGLFMHSSQTRYNPQFPGFGEPFVGQQFDAVGVEGDSPGLEMRGLRIHSRLPSPDQKTVCPEDVMMDHLANTAIHPETSTMDQTFAPQAQPIPASSGSLPYQLVLSGIPPEGKKTRVETQLKVDLHLIQKGSKEPARGAYQWLQLPSHTVSRSRFRIPNLKNLPTDIPPEEILHLESSVVCSSNPTKTVNICDLCMARERRRTHRNKDYKRKTTKKPRAPSPTPPDETQRIVIFNCPELQPFQSATIPLPSRITCYCRHHNEKHGFMLVLVAKNWQGRVVGQALSYNIVITDDHKAQAGERRGSGEESGKTSRRSSFESEESDEPRKALTSQPGTQGLPTPAGSSTNLPSLPAKQLKIPKNLSMTRLTKLEPLSQPPSKRHAPYPQPFHRALSMNNIPSYTEPNYAGGRWKGATAPTSANTSRSNSPPETYIPLPPQPPAQPFFTDLSNFGSAPVSPSEPTSSPLHSALQSPLAQPSFIPQWPLSVPGITIPADLPRTTTTAPTIHKLIPSEGPMAGGIEVTILGHAFNPGLTPFFGDLPAPHIDYYPPTTIIAIAPPSPVPGPVLVTLRDPQGQTVSDITNLDVKQLFTYKNHTDRDLCELALQIMGYKWFGKVEEARNVAAMIIGNQQTTVPATGESVEESLVRCLDGMDRDSHPFVANLSARSKTGHTLLHYAAMAGYPRLLSALLVRGVDATLRDLSGFTPLHYAAWLGRVSAVRVLVAENLGLLALKTPQGKTPEGLAAERGRTGVCAVLDRAVMGEVSRTSSLVSLRSELSRGSLSEYFGGSEQSSDVELDPEEEEEEQEEDLQMGSLRRVVVDELVDELVAEQELVEEEPEMPRMPSPMERMVPISAVTAFFNEFFTYQRRKALNTQPPVPKPKIGLVSDLEETYDDPPPAYSQLPLPPPPGAKDGVEKFSLATRLSLRGRYILKLTGMAKDAEFTPEELDAVKWNVRISLPNDYMLIYFWIPMLLLFFGWTAYNWGNLFGVREAVGRIVEVE